MRCAATTLSEYLRAAVGTPRDAGPGELAGQIGLVDVVEAMAGAVRQISDEVDRIGLDPGRRAAAGATNVHGETQQPLDLIGNDIVVRALAGSDQVAALASEELPDLVPTPGATRGARFVVAFDPLDGSSNIDVNVGVGTIFSILLRIETASRPTVSDLLQPGTAQVAAGFALYGPATVLVLTLGAGTDGFTLDRATGDFVLTHPSMAIPSATREYAVNSSNRRFWEAPVQRYVAECEAGAGGPREVDFNTRWVASLVAETYRILTRGGVFLYPRDTKTPGRAGRLRSVYECNPIAFLVEQAGGAASTGRGRTSSERPGTLHERAPLIFGSRGEVERLERYHREFDGAPEAEAAFDASLFNTRSLFRAS